MLSNIQKCIGDVPCAPVHSTLSLLLFLIRQISGIPFLHGPLCTKTAPPIGEAVKSMYLIMGSRFADHHDRRDEQRRADGHLNPQAGLVRLLFKSAEAGEGHAAGHTAALGEAAPAFPAFPAGPTGGFRFRGAIRRLVRLGRSFIGRLIRSFAGGRSRTGSCAGGEVRAVGAGWELSRAIRGELHGAVAGGELRRAVAGPELGFTVSRRSLGRFSGWFRGSFRVIIGAVPGTAAEGRAAALVCAIGHGEALGHGIGREGAHIRHGEAAVAAASAGHGEPAAATAAGAAHAAHVRRGDLAGVDEGAAAALAVAGGRNGTLQLAPDAFAALGTEGLQGIHGLVEFIHGVEGRGIVFHVRRDQGLHPGDFAFQPAAFDALRNELAVNLMVLCQSVFVAEDPGDQGPGIGGAAAHRGIDGRVDGGGGVL